MFKIFTHRFLVLFIISSFLLVLPSQAQVITVGTGTSPNDVSPINSCYEYNYTQQIYTAAEVLAANSNTAPSGMITSVGFHHNDWSYNFGTAEFNTWTVSIAFVSKTNFTSTTDWVPAASFTQVYSGIITFPNVNNWITIPLTTPLAWNGTSDIVISVLETVPDYNCSMYFTSSSTGTNNRVLYYYSDVTVPNPTAPPTAVGRSTTRPNVRFNFQSQCNASTVYPASATTQASTTNVCYNAIVDFNITPITAMPPAIGLTYQWQNGTTATGPWNNIGTAGTSANASFNVTTPGFYRCLVLCNGTPTTFASTPIQLTINNPSVASSTPATRCGPGTVTLNASPQGTGTIRWYNSLTANTELGTGNSFVTPFLPATTTFYAASSNGLNELNRWFGTGTNSIDEGNPYYTYYDGNKSQYLILASELTAQGYRAGPVKSIAFEVTSVGSLALTNYSISMKNTTTASLPLAFETGVTSVFTATSYMPILGVNTHTLTGVFNWDGVSNILIQTCFNNSTYATSHEVKYTTGYNFNATYYNAEDGNPTFCTNPDGYAEDTLKTRPNIKLAIDVPCEGTRVPVVATVTSPLAITAVYDSVVCNNATTYVNISSNLSNYNTYNWVYVGPATGTLFTNAAATAAYAGTSRTNIYFKTTTPGLHRIVVNGQNTVTNCATSDTFRVFVNPNPNNFSILGSPDTLCLTGNSDISVINAAYLKSGYFNWYQSTNGTNYTALASPTLPFNTGTITSDRFYRIITRTSNNVNCDTINKTIRVNNPTILSTLSAGRCGPGSVTLVGEANPGESVYWYSSATAQLPVYIGDTFNTPYLANTSTFYAAAGVGASQPPASWVNTGTQSFSSSNPNPFYTLYYGNKNQSLVRASELTALGFSAGTITEIAWRIGSVYVPSHTGFTVKIKQVTGNTLTAFDNAGFTTVYTVPALTVTANAIQNLVLQTPFVWDGTSNLIIETCYNNNTWSSSNEVEAGPTGFAASVSYYDDIATVCAATNNNTSSNNRPNMRFTMTGGCFSNRVAVSAFISEKPEVDLGQDIERCVDSGAVEFLNARNPGLNYNWDNGYNGQVRVIDASGTYWVVVDNNGCVSTDTINVLFKPNPISRLGNDTTTCIGASVALNAGSGASQYYWNTGATTSSITVDRPGTYFVVMTGANGCVKVDTIVVNQVGRFPSYSGIRVNNVNVNTFRFSLPNAANIASVSWDFGDGSPLSYIMTPTHSYAANGNYVVRMIANSACGSSSDTTTIHIKGYTDLNELEVDNRIKIYPNPAKNYVQIAVEHDIKINQVNVLSATGRLIKVVSGLNSSEVRLETDDLTSGFYYLTIETKDGVFKRKLDIIK